MPERQRKRGQGGRRKSKEFMDAAREAYVRHLALQKWRELRDAPETLELTPLQAVSVLGSFPERGAYRDIWERCWQSCVVAAVPAVSPSLFGYIERAVQQALQEEELARRQHGEGTIEDSLAYKAFVDYALDRLFAEEAGSLEEL